MKEKKWLKIIYVLTFVSIFLPWFTFNAQMTGYTHGWLYLDWFVVQMIFIGIYLFGKKKSRALMILAEAGAVMNLVAMVLVFGLWQGRANIILGFQWRDGLITAQPGYWVAAALFITLFVLLQVDLLKKEA